MQLDVRGSELVDVQVVAPNSQINNDSLNVDTASPSVEEVPMGRGHREWTKSTRLNDFVVYAIHCSKDPLSSLLSSVSTSVIDFRYGPVPNLTLCKL